ncbi:hypothetical protein [Halomonas sp. E19]|uniref:hypothetical protein n=1 Tax=Halomonas sp. E19 TaxID=3397247 RepID=UPI00403398DE
MTAQRHSDRGLFVDIRAKDFDAAPLGTAFTKMMGRMHALDAQGGGISEWTPAAPCTRCWASAG